MLKFVPQPPVVEPHIRNVGEVADRVGKPGKPLQSIPRLLGAPLLIGPSHRFLVVFQALFRRWRVLDPETEVPLGEVERGRKRVHGVVADRKHPAPVRQLVPVLVLSQASLPSFGEPDLEEHVPRRVGALVLSRSEEPFLSRQGLVCEEPGDRIAVVVLALADRFESRTHRRFVELLKTVVREPVTLLVVVIPREGLFVLDHARPRSLNLSQLHSALPARIRDIDPAPNPRRSSDPSLCAGESQRRLLG